MQLRTAADPHEWLTLEPPRQSAADRAFTLSLTEDGRPASTDATATGRAGNALRTVVSAVSTVAGVALGVLGKGGLSVAGLGDEESWEQQHQELAELRSALQGVQTKGRAALSQAYAQAIDTTDPAER